MSYGLSRILASQSGEPQISAKSLKETVDPDVSRLLQPEKAEAEDRITLRHLRSLANALDCDLVYGLVPRAGSARDLMKNRARAQAKQDVIGAEHSMALEDQAVGNLEEAIEAETRRIVRKHAGR